MKNLIAVLLVGVLLSTGCGPNKERSQPKYTRNQILAKITDTSYSLIENKLREKGIIVDLVPLQTDPQVVKITSKDLSAKELVALTKDLPEFEKVEPNYIYHTLETPNDERMGELWGMINTGQVDSSGQVGLTGTDIDVERVWAAGFHGNKETLVAVIDTGIAWNHPDLVDNLYTNPGESGLDTEGKDKSTNAKDDDGNGFIDDIHGWNFNAKNNQSQDDHDHGTHVAGTIGAKGNNGLGVAGVNWDVSLLPVKFLSASGSGSLEDAVNAINYARLMGVKVMSNSWGGGGASELMKEAIVKANEAGILFVAAAGNDSSDNDKSPTYPASYQVPNVVSVAAIDNQNKIASFSNYGATKVHVAAPGVRTLSTVKDGTYKAFSGTSMATPHVSGVAALLMSSGINLSPEELKNRLITTSNPSRSLDRKSLSGGRVSVYNALNNIVPIPDKPDEKLWQVKALVTESTHPYENNIVKRWELTVPGAKFLRVFFERIDLEERYDTLNVLESPSNLVETLSGSYRNYRSNYIVGDTVTLELKTDVDTVGWGFKITKLEYIR